MSLPYAAPTHKPLNRPKRSKDLPGDPFYWGHRWRKVRLIVLRRQPLCVVCMENGVTMPSTEVDHIKPRRDRPDLAYDLDNLRGLCKSCHSVHTWKSRHVQEACT